MAHKTTARVVGNKQEQRQRADTKSSQTLGECGCMVVWKKDCQLAADWAGVLIFGYTL